MEAQNHKLDFVADSIQLKKGENVLDIGCGWGRLAKYFTEKYGAKVTGVTLSEEQKKYADKLNSGNGAKIVLQDAMKLYTRKDLVPEGGFDKITCLEMAEHVGIKRYDEFLSHVHNLLKDDGTLYFQVAGLRRKWQYEDIAWGLFMGEHIFPVPMRHSHGMGHDSSWAKRIRGSACTQSRNTLQSNTLSMA